MNPRSPLPLSPRSVQAVQLLSATAPVSPGSSVNLPASHAMHSSADVVEYFPAGHGVQAAALHTLGVRTLSRRNAAAAVWSTKCLNWSIVTRAHVPRQRHNFCWNAAAASSARCAPRGGEGTAGGHRHAARYAKGALDARHKGLLRVASCLALAAEILSVAGHEDDLVGSASNAACRRLVRVVHFCRRAGGALAGADPGPNGSLSLAF